MFRSTLNNYIPSDKTIKRDSGDKSYPIWLIVNPKHPAVRHNIWTPALAEIQDKVYREIHTRIDTTNIYIRNAICDSTIVPNTLNWWGAEVGREIETFREIALEHEPKILISFGAFPFEFLRRAYEILPEKGPKYWSTSNLGDEFGRSIENFDINKTNRIPLLRKVISSGKFIEDHGYFGQHYFHYVGTKIAEKIVENKDHLKIWI
ncbi:hypothetical protein [Desulfosporosinus sp. BG]|uniref:hypothetical protein n=1 Tax=Desulfosporosinus sp. BG TaxID=1633135 RepID=UPI000839F4AE|nr:hypothetical protein [Desulfosporosinus sp. BG]ODA39271.1 Uracil phosphoribosyltransferase [Desulfosporosinus sp. BG]